ncbi:protein kinase [Streptomyces sp. IBSBF 2953]|nr:protein kinase [Streptomyces hayashii]
MRLRDSALALASRCTAEILAGRYRLDARIGSGGAADVYRGFDLRLRRAVAVKVFRPGTGTGAESEKGFGSEAVILARLQHPGLVSAYDAGRHDGRAYLVMQLIEGSTLKARIAEGALPRDVTVALGADLARALDHAHEAGIVHRDVKPSNILLGASGRPYLTDFGISRVVDATTCTATGTLVGTAAYLSPEQVLGRPVGRPADVYALGLVLLECLTGRLEYDGGPLEAAIARLHRRPVLPTALPGELASLLRDMTALDEQSRPSALDCARTLAALAAPTVVAPTVAAPAGSVAPTAPAAEARASVPSRESAQDDDATHLDASPAPERAAAKAAPARGRVLVAGGAFALATVMTAALAVTDGLPHPGSDGNMTRAVTRQAEHGDSEGDSAASDDDFTTPKTAPAATHDTSDAPHREAASARSARPPAGNVSPEPVDATVTSSGSRPGGGAQAERKPATPGKKAGDSARAKKAEKPEPTPKEKKHPKPSRTD